MNPKNFGSLAKHHQDPWKAPLPQFIEAIYFRRFKKTKPDQVNTLEEVAAARHGKKIAKQARKASCNTPIADGVGDVKTLGAVI